MLGLVLARSGVDVIVLEKHADFFRDFRGDTIHPSTIDLLDQLGLRERFDALPQSPITTLDVVINGNRMTPVDFSHLHGVNCHIALMPQWDFLNLLAEEGARYPGFTLMMNTEVTGLLREGTRVTGVTAKISDSLIEITAPLTIAADGRDSTARAASGLAPREFGVEIDVLWFRVPKPDRHVPDTLGYLNAESMVVTFPRPDYYQSVMLIAKDSFPAVRAAGLLAFRERLVRAAPVLESVVDGIRSWDQIKLLTVKVNRLDRWWLPGLLCIGDAAHAMSPAFGVGVNYAIQDAVAAANLLAAPLHNGSVSLNDLERVQLRRMPPVKCMQPIQLRLHSLIAKPGGGAFLHNPMRWYERCVARLLLPILRRIAARMVGRGFRPERISAAVLKPTPPPPHAVRAGAE